MKPFLALSLAAGRCPGGGSRRGFNLSLSSSGLSGSEGGLNSQNQRGDAGGGAKPNLI